MILNQYQIIVFAYARTADSSFILLTSAMRIFLILPTYSFCTPCFTADCMVLLPSNNLKYLLLSSPDSFGILWRYSDLIIFPFAEWRTGHLFIPNDMSMSRPDLVTIFLQTSKSFHFKLTHLGHPYKVYDWCLFLLLLNVSLI